MRRVQSPPSPSQLNRSPMLAVQLARPEQLLGRVAHMCAREGAQERARAAEEVTLLRRERLAVLEVRVEEGREALVGVMEAGEERRGALGDGVDEGPVGVFFLEGAGSC